MTFYIRFIYEVLLGNFMLKELYKKTVPVRVQNIVHAFRVKLYFETRLINTAFSDYWRYRKYACMATDDTATLENLSAMIIMEAHKIEKAFSLPHPRPGFGVSVITGLIRMLKQYKADGCDCEQLAFRKAQSVLAEYIRYHDQIGHDLGLIKAEILPWADMQCDIGGYHEMTREGWLEKARGNYEDCALSRSSVRTYGPDAVPNEEIMDAVRIARKTPSVCNRQAWHTYIVKSPGMMAQIMELQAGCRGFGDTANFMAVITANIRSFVGPYERNQAYIDGGLYAMSFLYALHYKGMGACPLHWMVPPERSSVLRLLLGIKDSENIIMVISAGSLPSLLRTAKSVRHDASEKITFL
jgi:nitroreductase